MRYFVINRERDVHRKEHMLEFEKRLGIKLEFFKALDGVKDLNVLDTNVNNIKFLSYNSKIYLHDVTKENALHNVKPSYGLLAGAITHFELYYKLLTDENEDAYCIFEDDVKYLHEDSKLFHDHINFLSGASKKYDLVVFHPRFLNVISKENISNHLYYQHKSIAFGGSFAYVISKKGASKFISYFRNWIYSSSDDNLSFCTMNNIFSSILIPKRNILHYREDFETTVHDDTKHQDNIHDCKWTKEFKNDDYKDYEDFKTNFSVRLD